MVSLTTQLALGSLVCAAAFQPAPSARSRSSLGVAVDPSTVTKKEYEDICGVQFDDESLKSRLKSTNYLYPKHVEVIEDIAPIAGAMVDEIVSEETARISVHGVMDRSGSHRSID